MILTSLLLPLLSSLTSGLFGRHLGQYGARIVTNFLMLVNLELTLSSLFYLLKDPQGFYLNLGEWFHSQPLQVFWSFQLDTLTISMYFIVNLVSTLVHIYSCVYMAEDPHIPRFMSYLSLFTFFMLVLVSGDNLPVLFVGWEGVGICSFLLIGFWFTRIQASKSALKALLVNRIGDIALTIAMALLFCVFRTLDFQVIFSLTPYKEAGIINLIAFLLVLGAMGKSAQIFLHTWLPDAMEGPTPVSALIHAATMVTAGVFLVIKSASLMEYATPITFFLALVGSTTAFFSATVGMVQVDLKKVIAYSTCSQLGYMFLACGLSAYNISLFHLVNHALFKALLFLSAGAVIHSMGDEQDMRKLGGLNKALPFVYSCFVTGSLALTGVPFLTGYYSKDLIIEWSFIDNTPNYNLSGGYLFNLALITAYLTAFYSFRLLFLTFLSTPRLHKVNYLRSHGTPVLIAIPLLILGLGSIFWGYLSRDAFVGLGSLFLEHNLLLLPHRNNIYSAEFLDTPAKLFPLVFTLVGFWSFYVMTSWDKKLFLSQFFLRKKDIETSTTYLLELLKGFRRIHAILFHKWFFDLLYNRYLNKPLLIFSYKVPFEAFDKGVVELFGPTGYDRVLDKTVTLLRRVLKSSLGWYMSLSVHTAWGFWAFESTLQALFG